MTVFVMIMAVLIATVVGYFIGRLGRGDTQQMKLEHEKQLRAVEQELEDYRQQVTEHFKGTSQLVEQMNENYRAVYMHLAEGAQQLTDEKAILEVAPSPLIAEKEVGALPSEAETPAETPLSADAQPVETKPADDETDSAESARKAGL